MKLRAPDHDAGIDPPSASPGVRRRSLACEHLRVAHMFGLLLALGAGALLERSTDTVDVRPHALVCLLGAAALIIVSRREHRSALSSAAQRGHQASRQQLTRPRERARADRDL
ncbi:MAG: hypothetical protein KC636_37780 [Myxococcales bacterium]|nr:hypothetical protein [Myxococcales bacterium]